MQQQLISKQAQTRYKSFRSIQLIIINICLSSFYFGHCLAYFNSINFDDIMKIYNIQFDRSIIQGLLTGCISISAGVGALVSKYFLEAFSRRNCFLLTNILIICSTIILQINNLTVLAVCRLVQGFCVGLLGSFVSLFVKEFSPVEISGQFGNYHQLFIGIGLTSIYTLTFIFSLFLQVETYYRIIFSIPIFTAILQSYILIFKYPYETPKYLLANNQQAKAKQIIRLIYKKKYQQQIFQEKKRDLEHMGKISTQKLAQHDTIQLKQLSNLTIQDSEVKIQKSSLQLGKKYKNNPLAVFASIHISILQQLVGVGIIVAYGGQITLLTFPFLEKFIPIIIHSQIIIGALFAIQFLRTRGRVQLFQIGTATLSVSLLVIALSFHYQNQFSKILIMIGVFVYRAMFGFTLGPLVWLYIPQIVQPNIIPYATMCNFGFQSIVMITYPIITQLVLGGNPSGLFLFFSIYTGIAFFVNRYCLIETKGKTEYQIRNLYNLKYPI